MRKYLFLPCAAVAVCLLCFSKVHAQNSSPYWSIYGNSNTSTSSKLGTTNGIPLRILTKNIERIRIDTAGRVGIGTTSPTARLMVNTPSNTNPLVIQIGGLSKLFMHANGGLAVGGPSTPPATGLYVKGNVGIGTNTPIQKLHVVGNGVFTGMVGIGTTAPTAQLHVEGGSTTAIYGNTTGQYGVFASGGSYGVYGQSGNTGVYGNGGSNGVYGESYNGLGGYFHSTNSWALEATTDNGYYAGVFFGHLYTSAGLVTSDGRLKMNIEDMGDAMRIITKLQPKHYEFKSNPQYAALHLPSGTHYGLIAQDLEQVLPNLVHEETFQLPVKTDPVYIKPNSETAMKTERLDVKAVNYVELIPILVKALQEQDKRMQDQEAENKAKDQRIMALEKDVTELHQMVLELKGRNAVTDHSSAYLEQNTPNPVSGATSIRYYIPDHITSAQLNLTNTKGQVIKTITIPSKGAGQLNINTALLASGTYNYTLYIDGKAIESKRMVIGH